MEQPWNVRTVTLGLSLLRLRRQLNEAPETADRARAKLRGGE